MARKKKTDKPMSMEEFVELERKVAEEAAREAMERREREREERLEAERRRHLAGRTMRQIVETLMTPPEAVRLPNDFATAWATDRASFLNLINRPLTAEETKGVAGAMAVLMEHNRRLRLLAKDLVERLAAAKEAFGTVAECVNSTTADVRAAWIAGEDYIDVEED